MTLNFHKMNGAGNDFVVIDNRELQYQLSGEQISQLCDRQRGVGADGLLAVEPAESGADFKFRYYNADGGEAEMCGNGARCFGKYTAQLLGANTELVQFETIAGTLSATLIGDSVKIAMSKPFDLTMNLDIQVEGITSPIHFINTGVPHVVVFVDDLEKIDVLKYGAALRYHKHFNPAGTNINFAQVTGDQHIAIRTYERGVEGETLACGTGMTACALIHHLQTKAASPIAVDVKGGETLSIGFTPDSENSDEFSDVTLTGPADFVFEGQIEI